MRSIIKTTMAAGIVLAALFLVGFTDLPEDHWAYGAVTQLSQEGTVSGLPDGSFRPNDPVTRSQFVKMLGYRSEVRNDYISDIDSKHWAYDVLVHSPLRLKDRAILPDEPMTREDAALYIYDCYANGEKSDAPSVITKGLAYPDEIGWVYERGIMVGSDGLNLRLSSGLTRGEAATLIVNARQKLNTKVDFADIVSDEILKTVFESSALFDVDYKRDAVLTNGQIARAAYRLRLDRVEALWYDEEADFDHPYANDLKAMETVLGSGRISAGFADSAAMPEDAYAMLAYGVASKIHTPVGYGGATQLYLDAAPASKALEPALTFAYRNGIRPFSGGVLKTGVPVTHKMAAAVLLQYDLLWGLQTSVTVDGTAVTYRDEPMRLTADKGTEVYRSVPASVPLDAAVLSFVNAEGKEITPGVEPKVNYPFCNDLRDGFASYLNELCAKLGGVSLTYYPQLVYDNGGGMTVRVRVNAGKVPGVRQFTAGDGSQWAEIPLEYTFLLG